MPKRTWSQTNAALERFLNRELRRTSVPGAAVGILHRGRRFTAGAGVTNVDHPLPVTSDTMFQIGSTTKTFTATAIMQLVEQGRIDLDAKVRRYIPELRMKDPNTTRNVTVRHLLTHMGGWIGDYFVNTGWSDDAMGKSVAKMAEVKQLTPLGTVWSYSNSGFVIAGRIIEKVTKKLYEVALKEMLFDPLEMTNTAMFPHEIMTRRYAVGHITTGKKSQLVPGFRGSRGGSPAGAIVSSAVDQLKWAAFHLGDGSARSGKRLLRKSTLRLMQKEQVHVGSMIEGIGLSWLLNSVGGVKTVSHGGTTIGQLSAFLMVPERDFAVTVLTNSTAGRVLHPSIVRWALENYLGLAREERPRIRVEPAELAKYEGKYQVASTGNILEISARGQELLLKFPPPPSVNSRPSARIPSIPLRFYAPDKVVGSRGPYSGGTGDFLRASSGRIEWLRFGGRLYRRVSEAQAARSLASFKSRIEKARRAG